MSDVRIDKWLWAMRAFKTRNDAAESCRAGRVQVNGVTAKPSREVHIGDVVSFRRVPVTYSYRVLDVVGNRVAAKDVARIAENITPQTELDKLNTPRETIFISRERGTGRPTKRDRRELDAIMDGFK